MNKRLVLALVLIFSVISLTSVSASIRAYSICSVQGEINEVKFQQEYIEYNSDFGCDAFPCTLSNYTVPAKYIVNLKVIEVIQQWPEINTNSGLLCNTTYIENNEYNFSVYASYLKLNDTLKVGNIIQGNATRSLGEDYFINGQYEIKTPEPKSNDINYWQKIANWFRRLFSN